MSAFAVCSESIVMEIIDTNIDGNLSVSEVAFSQRDFNKTLFKGTGDPDYNANYDFDGNGSVNIIDFGCLYNTYGTFFNGGQLSALSVLDANKDANITSLEIINSFSTLASNQGKTSSDANFNGSYDFDASNKIDLADYTILSELIKEARAEGLISPSEIVNIDIAIQNRLNILISQLESGSLDLDFNGTVNEDDLITAYTTLFLSFTFEDLISTSDFAYLDKNDDSTLNNLDIEAIAALWLIDVEEIERIALILQNNFDVNENSLFDTDDLSIIKSAYNTYLASTPTIFSQTVHSAFNNNTDLKNLLESCEMLLNDKTRSDHALISKIYNSYYEGINSTLQNSILGQLINATVNTYFVDNYGQGLSGNEISDFLVFIEFLKNKGLEENYNNLVRGYLQSTVLHKGANEDDDIHTTRTNIALDFWDNYKIAVYFRPEFHLDVSSRENYINFLLNLKTYKFATDEDIHPGIRTTRIISFTNNASNAGAKRIVMHNFGGVEGMLESFLHEAIHQQAIISETFMNFQDGFYTTLHNESTDVGVDFITNYAMTNNAEDLADTASNYIIYSDIEGYDDPYTIALTSALGVKKFLLLEKFLQIDKHLWNNSNGIQKFIFSINYSNDDFESLNISVDKQILPGERDANGNIAQFVYKNDSYFIEYDENKRIVNVTSNVKAEGRWKARAKIDLNKSDFSINYADIIITFRGFVNNFFETGENEFNFNQDAGVNILDFAYLNQAIASSPITPGSDYLSFTTIDIAKAYTDIGSDDFSISVGEALTALRDLHKAIHNKTFNRRLDFNGNDTSDIEDLGVLKDRILEKAIYSDPEYDSFNNEDTIIANRTFQVIDKVYDPEVFAMNKFIPDNGEVDINNLNLVFSGYHNLIFNLESFPTYIHDIDRNEIIDFNDFNYIKLFLLNDLTPTEEQNIRQHFNDLISILVSDISISQISLNEEDLISAAYSAYIYYDSLDSSSKEILDVNNDLKYDLNDINSIINISSSTNNQDSDDYEDYEEDYFYDTTEDEASDNYSEEDYY